MGPFVVAAIVGGSLLFSGTGLKVVEPKNPTAQKVGTVLQVAGVGTIVGGALGSAIGVAGAGHTIAFVGPTFVKTAALASPITLGAVAGGVAGGTGAILLSRSEGH